MRVAPTLALMAILVMGTAVFASDPENDKPSASERPLIPVCEYQQRFQIPAYIVYDDNTSLGTKSIHCLGIYLAIELQKNIEMIAVGDFFTKEIIDAEEAVWVIGDAKPGERTKRWLVPFGRELDAQSFVQRYGGRLGNFQEVMGLVFEDLANDLNNNLRDNRRGE